ncbi:MAG: hypothetical protein ACRD25_12270, partial [Terracidiphilus sp.]
MGLFQATRIQILDLGGAGLAECVDAQGAGVVSIWEMFVNGKSLQVRNVGRCNERLEKPRALV